MDEQAYHDRAQFEALARCGLCVLTGADPSACADSEQVSMLQRIARGVREGLSTTLMTDGSSAM